jgi:EAL domain-containing protein (putative c-di-GMP-specific phosphodiesterase class I)
LCIEILETAALENIRVVALAVKECRALGLHIALDDFGTGYSSLTHLKNLNVDILKIDYSFISGMLNNADDQAIVNGVIALANSFGRRVIAEGVESLDQVRQLMTSGCDYIQGYYIARPMAADELPVWLANFQPDPLWLDNNEKGAIYDR